MEASEWKRVSSEGIVLGHSLSGRWRVRVAVAASAAVLAAAGCGRSDGLALVPVTGTVMLDGAPLGEGMIAFAPDASEGNAGPLATGLLDAQGRFELRSIHGRKGAVPGSHRVYLFDPFLGASGDEARPPTRIPLRYQDAATSGLAAEVQERGSNTFDFTLASRASPGR